MAEVEDNISAEKTEDGDRETSAEESSTEED